MLHCALPDPLAGIIATDIAVGQRVLQRTEFGGSQASAATVQWLELEFPSLSRPLTLRVHGLRLALQQVRLPKVRRSSSSSSRSSSSWKV